MTRLILAAALLALAATAHARPIADFKCGKFQIHYAPAKYFKPGPTCTDLCDGKDHYFDQQAPEGAPPVDRYIRRNKAGELFYKGNKCRNEDDRKSEPVTQTDDQDRTIRLFLQAAQARAANGKSGLPIKPTQINATINWLRTLVGKLMDDGTTIDEIDWSER
jgi:hypothetical protein